MQSGQSRSPYTCILLVRYAVKVCLVSIWFKTLAPWRFLSVPFDISIFFQVIADDVNGESTPSMLEFLEGFLSNKSEVAYRNGSFSLSVKVQVDGHL